jgi:hypothetical protein
MAVQGGLQRDRPQEPLGAAPVLVHSAESRGETG